MTGRDYALLIGLLLWFGGLCWLAVMLGIERDAHAVTKADYEKANENRTHTKTLNQNLLAELTKVRADRDRYQSYADRLAHAAGKTLLFLDATFALPTIAGHRMDDEEIRQRAFDPSPVYDRLASERPALRSVK